MTTKKAVKLASSKPDVNDPAAGDEMMEILMKFANTGMAETEKMMAEQPELFTPEEIRDFNDNKATFDKAPDVVEGYKKKLNEFDQLNEKVGSIAVKCDKIVRNHKIRQSYDNHDFVDPHSQKSKKKEKKEPKLEAGMIRYNEDGELVMKPHKEKD